MDCSASMTRCYERDPIATSLGCLRTLYSIAIPVLTKPTPLPWVVLLVAAIFANSETAAAAKCASQYTTTAHAPVR
eukprot:m.949402 g.949402  ORF g.949402 m.949402 type:complete len:76 (+) comp23852_c0_seq2:1830-2057(+)